MSEQKENSVDPLESIVFGCNDPSGLDRPLDNEWYWFKNNTILTSELFAEKASYCLEKLDQQYVQELPYSHTTNYLERYQMYRQQTYSQFLQYTQNPTEPHRWESGDMSEIASKINCDIKCWFSSDTLPILITQLMVFIKKNIPGFESIRDGTEKGRKSICKLLYSVYATNRDLFDVCDKCIFFALEKIPLNDQKQNEEYIDVNDQILKDKGDNVKVDHYKLEQCRYIVLYFLCKLREIQYKHTSLTSRAHNSVHICVMQENYVALSTLSFRDEEFWQPTQPVQLLPVELCYYNVITTQTYESIFTFLIVCSRMNITSQGFLDSVFDKENRYGVPHWETICEICHLLIFMIVNKVIVDHADTIERGMKHFEIVSPDYEYSQDQKPFPIVEDNSIALCDRFMKAVQSNTDINTTFLQESFTLERDRVRCTIMEKIERNLSLCTCLDKLKEETIVQFYTHEPRIRSLNTELRLSNELFFSRLYFFKGIFTTDILMNEKYSCEIISPQAFSFPSEIIAHYLMFHPERYVKDLVNLLILTSDTIKLRSGNLVTHPKRYSMNAVLKRKAYYDEFCNKFPEEF